MIRNRISALIQSKQRNRGNRYQQNRDILAQQPWWFEEQYHHKQMLSRINANNRNISNLVRQYQVNPSVYTLKQVERHITDNCQLIEQVDRWLNNFRYSDQQNALYKTEKAMIGHFQTMLTEQITAVFSNKQVITSVNNELDHQASMSRTMMNNSFSGHPANLNSSFEAQDRNRVFQQVNYKIQNLNSMLRRMNTMVVGQGDLVNRIDQNLIAGHENIVKANKQLKSRADREEGSGQFTCEGRVNTVITALYGLNLGIILLFFLKHLIF